MKQIIIFLLLIIIGIMGYNFYERYQRFNPPNYTYQPEQKISGNHFNMELLLDYAKAVEDLNGHIITQWSANKIDVRNPDNDNAQTLAAVSKYREKVGIVKYYELQLLDTTLHTPEIKAPSEEEKKKKLILEMFHADPKGNQLRLGERGALVYELQRILIKSGDTIKHDGLFRTETFNALKAFEQKNGLLPDGKLDAITLDYLLQ